MAGPYDFTGQNIENTYQRVLQTDGTLIYDGTGSLFTVTAIAAPAGPDKSVQFRDGTATSGSGTFTFDKSTNSMILTGSMITTGSNLLIGTTTLTGSLNVSGSTTQVGNNTLLGNTQLTGSVGISGSTLQVGNNTLLGNTILTGSITISGSFPVGSFSSSVNIYGDTSMTGYLKFNPQPTNIDTSISASYIFVSGSTNDLYFSQNGNGYSNITRLRWLEGNMYSGLLNGGVLSQLTSTIYQISSGSGIIVNLNASLNDNPYPTTQYVNWGNLSASIAPLSASYDQTFVAISSSGGTATIFAQGTPFFDGQYDTMIPLGLILHQNRSTIGGVKTQPNVAYGLSQRTNVFIKAFGPLKITGFNMSPSGSSTGSLIIGAGTAYSDGANYTTDPNNPSYVIDAGTDVSKIFRYYNSGSNWVYDTNGGAGYPTIDPTRYSLNGVLTAVPGTGTNRQWTNQRVFWFPNSTTKAIVVYYGNVAYATQLEAIAASTTELFTEAPNTAANAVYLGFITLRNNATFTDATSYKIAIAGLFRGGAGGGGTGGSSILLQTNGVNNSSQTVFNLKQGSNINLIDDGVGGITVSSTGGGGGGNNTSTGSYGSFYDTTIQAIGTVGAVYSMSLNNAPISNGVSLSGSVNPYNTYIKTTNAGIYDIQFSAQLDKTTGTSGIAYIWLRKNGLDLPETNTAVTLAGGANDKALAAWNWFVDANAGDYFQIVWAATNNNIRLYSTGSGAIDAAPAIPSLIVTANRVDQFLSNTGSFTGSFTGELIGTASWANNYNEIDPIFVEKSASLATTGSNTFIGDQIITGSVYITGSLNADAQVYEVSFLQKDSPPYSSGDNLIELDQDLITNPNYTRNTNTITVNSSGLYKIYNQCRISVTSGLSGEAELAVFINNNPYRTYFINNIKQSEISTYNFSCVANLNTSDTIEFHIYSLTEPFVLNTFSKIYTSIINSYMTIEKLN
jgi:hypothetical protein